MLPYISVTRLVCDQYKYSSGPMSLFGQLKTAIQQSNSMLQEQTSETEIYHESYTIIK